MGKMTPMKLTDIKVGEMVSVRVDNANCHALILAIESADKIKVKLYARNSSVGTKSSTRVESAVD